MTKIKNGWVVLISAFIFTLLFYKQALGINLMIYELVVLAWFLINKQVDLSDRLQFISLMSVVLTAAFTVVHHSLLSFIVNFIAFFVMIGVLSSNGIRSLYYATLNSISSFFVSQSLLRSQFRSENGRQGSFRKVLKRMRLLVFPLLIIVAFIFIYGASNAKFGYVVDEISDAVTNVFNEIFAYIEFAAVVTLIIGILIGNFIFLRRRDQEIFEKDQSKSDQFLRVRSSKKGPFKFLALINEYRSAVFLFVSLNVLLLILNALDVYWVWFNFEWTGQFLKDYVHNGTYLLLVSIFISIGLVLYYFRGNINFYKRNELLKKLTYTWIAQNVVLTISVAIRNWYYIQYYALAYKRIAIVFFLILTLIAMYTVYLKVRKIRSRYYLIRINTISLLLVLVFASAFNWDKIIANYNFSKADRSFVHLNFLAGLSDSSLPSLDQPLDKLIDVDTRQIESFGFKSGYGSGSSGLNFYRRVYMTPENYCKRITVRKQLFKRKWESKGFLSWNYAEQLAYNSLFN